MEKIRIELKDGKKVYFISDTHLGIGGSLRTIEKEKKVVAWLDEMRDTCAALIMCGDMFDFWYEWKKVVPRGYIRLMAAIARYTDNGIPVYFFTGNHDMWSNNYMVEHLGVCQYHDPVEMEISGRRFLVGHGDGLGPGDHKFKAMKALFKNKVARWLFSHLLHPDWAVGVADYFSRRSRTATGTGDKIYMGDDKEWLYLYCRDTLARGDKYDYFVFGHRHLLIDKTLEGGSRYVNLGDWLTYDSYGVWDGSKFEIKYYPER